jgi:hypothetical protein
MQYGFTRECLEVAQEALDLLLKGGVLLIHAKSVRKK